MLFINTRPTERANHLTQALDFPVLELPLLELVPNQIDIEQYQQLFQAQVVVVVSPTAAQLGLDGLKKSGVSLEQLEHIQWIAVGHTTAQVLQKVGITAHIPTLETSEGMLQLPVLRDIQQGCVAFWRGRGGRQFMMQHLYTQGIKILNFCLYYRQLPHHSLQVFKQNLRHIQHNIPVFVCISSEASWQNWLDLCKDFPDLIKQCIYLTLGERLTQLVQHSALSVRKIQSLTPKSIQEAVKEV